MKGKEINENSVISGINNGEYKMCSEEKELKQKDCRYLIDAFAFRTEWQNWINLQDIHALKSIFHEGVFKPESTKIKFS